VADDALPPLAWRTNLWLFLATVPSVFATYATLGGEAWSRGSMVGAAKFTATLLGILLAHEFGHFIAARIHKVDASLPFFIPLPILSPFGTMGAVIRMRGVIPTRRALLDIGASGPLAGLALALPLYAWGAAHSQVIAAEGAGGQLGESLMLKALDHVFAPPVPDGMELFLSPVAYAAWVGMFITMINLLPVGQLDGGHVAYSLFGPRQDRVAHFVHRSLLAFFFVSLVGFVMRDVRAGFGLLRFGQHVGNSLFWLVWFQVLAILGTLSAKERPKEGEGIAIRTRIVAVLGLAVVAWLGQMQNSVLVWGAWFAGLGLLLAMEVKWGTLRQHTLFDHPPTGSAPLGWGRQAIAIVTLAFFALLFMPTPMPL
jgi:Zn-dependent protease